MAERINACFYDIESLTNAFTLSCYRPDDGRVDIYYLVDDPALMDGDSMDFKKMTAARIRQKNQNFAGQVYYQNLQGQKANERLAMTFGVSDAHYVNDPDAESSFPDAFRPICDTDPDYRPEKAPWLMGYNSSNYDLTMLAYYFNLVWQPGEDGKRSRFKPTTARIMRAFNDELFSGRYIGNMRLRLWNDQTLGMIAKNFIMSGRQIDVAQLNERQRRVGLKRLLGMLGWQILESDKLRPGTDRLRNEDELADLIAYNVSDVVNLKELFLHPFYQGQFILKKGLLERYPDLVYEEKGSSYQPNVSPKAVRKDRLTIDSTSANFARKTLCPYGRLKDSRCVSFLYPAKEVCQKTGEKQRDILEESRDFFYGLFKEPDLREKFDRVYDFYKQFAGKNFNPSKEYQEDYGDEALPVADLAQLKTGDTNLFYYEKDGRPSTCYITFSIGGLHGSEYNRDLFEKDHQAWEQKTADLAYVKRKFSDPLALRQAKTVELPDGRVEKYNAFLTSKATIKAMSAAKPEELDQFWKDFKDEEPAVFKLTGGKVKLNERYAYTSADLTNHEDFTSYYPNMLRRLNAFYNEKLGEDRYTAIFQRKQELDVFRKDPKASPEERRMYNIEREGTKLILNSATGAADPRDEHTPSVIRMNNRIRSMRIIGQLFTYMIGQAQTYYGARIVSTNTDGLYSVLEKGLNDKILADEAKQIGVEIEPEELYLISKDSNNRMELASPALDAAVLSASGASLACRKDTSPTKSLSHPAIIDWALSEYLRQAAASGTLSAHFDRELGQKIMAKIPAAFPDPAHRLRMFQNVLASNHSREKASCIFGVDPAEAFDLDDPSQVCPDPLIMQRYNRVFICKDDSPLTVHLYAATAKKVTPAMQKKRQRDGEPLLQDDQTARLVLEANGFKTLGRGREAAVKRIPNLNPAWFMHLENRAINLLDPEAAGQLLDSLDLDKYLELVESAYENNWRKLTPAE